MTEKEREQRKLSNAAAKWIREHETKKEKAKRKKEERHSSVSYDYMLRNGDMKISWVPRSKKK